MKLNSSEIDYIPTMYEDIQRREENINKIIEVVSSMKSSVAIDSRGKTEETIFRNEIDLGETIDILNDAVLRLREYGHEQAMRLNAKGAIFSVENALNTTPYPIKKRIP